MCGAQVCRSPSTSQSPDHRAPHGSHCYPLLPPPAPCHWAAAEPNRRSDLDSHRQSRTARALSHGDGCCPMARCWWREEWVAMGAVRSSMIRRLRRGRRPATWAPHITITRRPLLPNGKVLVAGGCFHSGSAELYDPASQTWTATGNMNRGRDKHTATLLFQWPGAGGGRSAWQLPFRDQTELYDPASGTWTLTHPLLNSDNRKYHTATLLPNGKVLVAGESGPFP